MTDALREALEGSEFYNLMQTYRQTPIAMQMQACAAFEAVKSFVRNAALQEPAPVVAREPTFWMLQAAVGAADKLTLDIDHHDATALWQAMYDAQAPVEPAPVVQPEIVAWMSVQPHGGTPALYWGPTKPFDPYVQEWRPLYAAPSQLVEDARAKAIEECAKVCELVAAEIPTTETPYGPAYHFAEAAKREVLAQAVERIRSIAKGVES